MAKKNPEHLGPNGYCVCMHCGTQVPKTPGVPCTQTRCPNCGKPMLRYGSEHYLKAVENKKKKEQNKQTTMEKKPQTQPAVPQSQEIEKQGERKPAILTFKIAIPTDDGITISQHFGRTLYFKVYEFEGKSIIGEELRSNTAHAGEDGPRHEHGHSHDHDCEHGGDCGENGHHEDEQHVSNAHGRIFATLHDVDVILAGGMGRRIYNDLVAKGYQIYTTNATTVDDALKAFIGEIMGK